jgi:hypothetical protein
VHIFVGKNMQSFGIDGPRKEGSLLPVWGAASLQRCAQCSIDRTGVGIYGGIGPTIFTSNFEYNELFFRDAPRLDDDNHFSAPLLCFARALARAHAMVCAGTKRRGRAGLDVSAGRTQGSHGRGVHRGHGVLARLGRGLGGELRVAWRGGGCAPV